MDSTESDESDASSDDTGGKVVSSALDLRELPVRLRRYPGRDDAAGDRANAVS